MCGIIGFTGNQDESKFIRAMNSAQIHRGPDDEGFYYSPKDQMHLAMRRLSILDLAGGHQPMTTFDNGLWIVFNGEIYNAPELRAELEADQVPFKTQNSDTEVLLYLYRKYGTSLLSKINGMFSFVLHDLHNGILFGARDRLGIKPFYYSLSGGRFSFASELKSLLELPWISRDLDYQSVYNYFSFQCIPSPGSIFKDVKKLEPAQYFTYRFSNKDLKIENYWKPNFSESCRLQGADLNQFVREEIKSAVKRWMLSDVPVGCSLSGGLDSSTVVAMTSLIHPNYQLRTYSLGFADAPDLDERNLAKLVSKKYNTLHKEIVIRSEDLLDDYDKMIYHLEEPYAGGLPSWFVFKAMAKDVKVALTGSGGDELFGNYGKWIPFENPYRKLKRLVRYGLQGEAYGDYLKFPTGYLYPIYFRDAQKRNSLFNSEVTQSLRPSEVLIEKLWNACPSQSPRNRVPWIDTSIQLPEEFLHMTDRFSMAHSLEARTPFLDHELMEKMYSIPANIRTSPDRLKYLLINAVGDLLPPELMSAKKKGFVLPMSEWLRGRLRPQLEKYLSPEYLRKQGIFKTDLYESFAKPHLSGKDLTDKNWTLLNFQFWYERFVNKNPIEVHK